MLQTTANSEYSYLSFFPDVIIAGKAENQADTSSMLDFRAKTITCQNLTAETVTCNYVNGRLDDCTVQITDYNGKQVVVHLVDALNVIYNKHGLGF